MDKMNLFTCNEPSKKVHPIQNNETHKVGLWSNRLVQVEAVTGQVRIEDADPTMFQHFLKFL